MIITPIKTRVLVPPKDDLLGALKEALPQLREKSVIAVTSKVVSVWQGRCIPISEGLEKDDLIIREADKYLPRDFVPNRWVMHTIKNNLFVPSAGIDESNANGYYVLWPEKPSAAAKQLYDWVRKTYSVNDVGVVITDSHTIPLRRGTMGISLAYYGFRPLKDYRDTPDLFDRPFKVSQLNIADGLAAAAVLAMGEGNEQTPCAVITDYGKVEFSSEPFSPQKPWSAFEIEEKEDLYYPLLSSVPWEQGGEGIGEEMRS